MLQDNPDSAARNRRKIWYQHQWAELLPQGAHRQGLGEGVELRPRRNKFVYGYVLTSKGIVEKVLLAGRFLSRKMTEYEQLQVEIEALKVEMGCLDAHGRKIQNA